MPWPPRPISSENAVVAHAIACGVAGRDVSQRGCAMHPSSVLPRDGVAFLEAQKLLRDHPRMTRKLQEIVIEGADDSAFSIGAVGLEKVRQDRVITFAGSIAHLGRAYRRCQTPLS